MEAKKWKKTAQIPEETARAVDRLADRLEEMDKAEGCFGEAVNEDLSDEYLEQIVGGAILPVTTSVLRLAGPTGTDREPN